MAKKVVTGSEPILAEALAYLARKGIPATDIRGISMDAEIGKPALITVTMYVNDAADLARSAVPDVE